MQQATSNKQQATSNKQQATSNKQQATSNKQQATSNKQQATSNKQQATSNKQQATRCFKQIIALVISIIILGIISKLSLRGTGLFSKVNLLDIATFSIFIIFLSSSRKIFYFFVLPVIAILALYLPIGLNFGSPRYQHIVSLFATDFSETSEFLGLIPTKHYIYTILILSSLILYRWIITKFNLNLYRNKFFILSSFLLLAFQLPISSFFHQTYKEGKLVKKEMDELKKYVSSNNWKRAINVKSDYDDYILVIGESERSDYLHSYGYPVENTPFRSNANGVQINGFLAAGEYTIGSLKHMLTLSNKDEWKENYSLNIVDMVKSAGIKTYWLSNQGFIGRWDSPISSIAAKSDVKYFLKSGGYASKNTSDFELIPIFNQRLTEKHTGKRFFVLHLVGSHPNACDRLVDYKRIFDDKELDSKHTYINCYISSIKKTDEFLSKIFDILKENEKKNNRSFSMVYISDHGLGHKEIEGKIILNNNPDVTKGFEYYTIPLFKFSSDDTHRKEYNVFKSGLNFIDGIANWVGIENEYIDKKIELFSNHSDLNDYGQLEKLKKIKNSDPAIDITPVKNKEN